jgi:hypothetical protein
VPASIAARLARLEGAEHRRELEGRAAGLAKGFDMQPAEALAIVERVDEAYRQCARLGGDVRAVSRCMARRLGDDDAAADELLDLAERIAEDSEAGLTYVQIVRREGAEWRRRREVRSGDGG